MITAGLLVALAAACSVNGAPDNRGTEFIIGYMENIATSMNVELFVTTMRTTTVSVSVTAPRYSAAGINSQFTVTAGEVKQLFFNPSIRMAGSSFSSKGVLVSATDEVVIYGVNKETYSCDAFLGLPTDVLAKEYYAITYYPPQQQCELMVVGVHDSTSVSFRFGSSLGSQYVSYGGGTYRAGNTLTVNMNRYDTIQLVSRGDLSGTYITGSKAISVFSGNKKTNIGSGGSSDHLVEHLTPVDAWGKKFATVPVPLRTVSDYWRFIGSEANTRITISGGYSTSFTIGEGQMIQKTIPSTAYCYITSDKPILVVQFCLSQQSSAEQSDPMMMIIPPVEQYGADYTFATPKYSLGSYSNYFMFVVKESEKSGLRLDGNAFPSNTRYNTININGVNYVGGYVSVSEGSHTVRHTSPISIFGGYLYGQARYETYGFTTGMRLAPINTVCVPTTTQTGDGIDNDCDGLIDEEICTTENQGRDDDGDGTSDEDCATPPPIDGGWGNWGSYGACSLTCKTSGGATTGTYTRTRSCNNPTPKYDGKQCSGTSSETSSCTTSTMCPIHGNWASWGSWGGCSVSCDTGTKARSRTCTNPAKQYGGNDCSGSSSSSTSCYVTPCPSWSSWLSWGSCSKSCGTGSYTRSRTCRSNVATYGASACPNSPSMTGDCNTHNCPIDGGWTSWASWTSCSLTCKDYGTSQTGTRSRTRACTNPSPQYNGQDCPNFDFEVQVCTTATYCPIHGVWTSWASWSSCSVTCATGTKQRSRSCTNPSPRFSGNDCPGSTSSQTTCTLTPCPIDGAWTNWASWGTCTKTCGGGISTRLRSCTNPTPQYNGADCVGVVSETMDCNTQICIIDGDWGSWSSWGVCTVTCATGQQSRMRSCDNPLPRNGGLQCPGNSSQFQDCNTQTCPAPQAGVYQQLCPLGWFTCESGSVTCIQQAFVCDCDPDCDDGSDESLTYAQCNADLVASCSSGAERIIKHSNILLLMAMILAMLQQLWSS